MAEYFLPFIAPSYQSSMEASIGLAYIRLGDYMQAETHLLTCVDLERGSHKRNALGNDPWLSYLFHSVRGVVFFEIYFHLSSLASLVFI